MIIVPSEKKLHSSGILTMTDTTATQSPRTHVIAIGNQKGGVGKTSNALHIAAALGELGKRVLVIDLDGNCGATRGLGVGTDWYGTFEMLLGEEQPSDVVVKNDPVEGVLLPDNVHIIPARRNLEQFESSFRQKHKFKDPSLTLIEPLQKLNGEYDVIILDTAPNASAPTLASYRGADWFILSTEASKLSVDGLNDALMDIQAVREAGNARLQLLGVVLCKVDSRTRIATHYVEQIRRDFEAAGERGAFETSITRATAVEAAQQQGKTLFQTEPSHKVADQFRQLSQEILGRIESSEASANVEAGGVSNG